MYRLIDSVKGFCETKTGLFGFLLVMALTAIPIAFVAITTALFGYEFNSAIIIFWAWFILEIIMLWSLERPIMIAAPFILPFVGLVVVQVIDSTSVAIAQYFHPYAAFAYNAEYVMVTVFGSEVTGCFAAVPVYFLTKLLRWVYEKIKYR